MGSFSFTVLTFKFASPTFQIANLHWIGVQYLKQLYVNEKKKVSKAFFIIMESVWRRDRNRMHLNFTKVKLALRVILP